MPVPSSDTLADDARLARAHQQFRLIVDAEASLRQRMLEDATFLDTDGGQWPESVRREREEDGRPCLQIDRTSGQIRQIINRILQGRPAIQVAPGGGGADLEKAEVRQGIIRYLEDQSDAEVAYALGCEHQIKVGRGYWRIVPAYVTDESDDPAQLFRQEPRILAVDNPFSVYTDPQFRYGTGQQPGSPMRFAFVPEDLDPDEYRERFGQEPPTGLEALRGTGDVTPDWFPRGKVRICEYFYLERTVESLTGPDGQTRRVTRSAVKWCLLNAVQILERRDIPGPYIPIVPVLGERSAWNGEVDLKGATRRAKDPQRMVNYGRSKTIETEALAPHAPFLAAFQSVEAYADKWNTANRRNWGWLPYDPYTPDGRPLPPPTRQFGEPPIQALLGMSREFENDLRATMQMPDVQGQELRREQSGKAIRFRELQSEVGNAHFAAHLRQAIVLTGKILNAWIPVYFDVPTQLEIVGKDGKSQSVIVHAGSPEAPAPMRGPAGRGAEAPAVVDLTVGRYDIKVSTGPSYQTQREENRAQLGDMLTATPALMPLIGDLYFENWDDPIGQQIAKRLRTANPVLVDESTAHAQIPPAFLQQHQQLVQMVQQLTDARDQKTQELQAQAAAKTQELALKRQEAVAEAQISLEKARLQAETDLAIARMKLETEREIAAIKMMMTSAPASEARPT